MARRNGDVVTGINEPALDDLILQVNNEIDIITKALNDIQMKMHEVNDYFKGDVAKGIQEKFKEISDQYSTFKSNLNSYSRDLTNIKSMEVKIDLQSTKFFNEKGADVRADRNKADAELTEERTAQKNYMQSVIEEMKISSLDNNKKSDNVNDK